MSVIIAVENGQLFIEAMSFEPCLFPPSPSNPSLKHLNYIMQLLAWNQICTLSFFILLHNVNIHTRKHFFFLLPNVLFHKPKNNNRSRMYQEYQFYFNGKLFLNCQSCTFFNQLSFQLVLYICRLYVYNSNRHILPGVIACLYIIFHC